MTAAVGSEPSAEALAATDPDRPRLTLYVNGASPMSARAIASARLLCDTHLADRYTLSIVDVNEDPAAVIRNRVVAVPTLVGHGPPPARRYVGDLSHIDRVLESLDIRFDPEPVHAVG